jgi:hypothetical protein
MEEQLFSLEKELKELRFTLRKERGETIRYNKINYKYSIQFIKDLEKEVEETKHALWFVHTTSIGIESCSERYSFIVS